MTCCAGRNRRSSCGFSRGSESPLLDRRQGFFIQTQPEGLSHPRVLQPSIWIHATNGGNHHRPFELGELRFDRNTQVRTTQAVPGGQ